MNYCGVTKYPTQRIWQHIVASRRAAYGCKEATHHCRTVSHLDGEYFYSFMPLAYVPNRSREHYESFIVKSFKYRLNYANLNNPHSIKVKDTPSRKGFYSRFRRLNPHQKLLPNLSTDRSLNLATYSCPQTSDFNPKLNDLLRISSLSKNISIHITPGTADATDWCQVDEFFGNSDITTPFGLHSTLSNIKPAIRKGLITSFTITKLVCPIVYQETKLTYTRLVGALHNLSDKAKAAKLYTYLDAAELIYNTFERKRAMCTLIRTFQHFKINRPPLSLYIRTPYLRLVHKPTLIRAGRYIVTTSTLPKSAQNLIYSRTTLVNKNPKTIGDYCCNNLKWAPNFDVNKPWPCCKQCTSMPHLPHRDTYGSNCLAFRADQYAGPFNDVLHRSLKTVPFPDRHTVFHGLVTGLLSFRQSLKRFTEIGVSVIKVKELASQCIKQSTAPDGTVYQYRIKALAQHFDGCVMHGLDKNTKMMFACCPHFYWHLMYTTFKFAATGSPTADLNYIQIANTPAQYIDKKKSSYKWSHIAPFRNSLRKHCDQRLARADVTQKCSKDKGRPMIKCYREPERLLKSRICKAGFFMLTHAGLDHFGISNTCLSVYKHRWKYREKLGTSVMTTDLLDDMSGFYTCLDRNGVLQRAQYVLDKFKSNVRRSKHWISVPRRMKIPTRFGKSSNDDRYVHIHVDEIIDVLKWASQFSSFMLGKHFLEQSLGLFQGCALSVILALFTASADEDRWLNSLGADRNLVFVFRYFDDRKLWFIYNPYSATSRCKALRLKQLSTQIYMIGIECEPEDSPNFLECCITEQPDGSLSLSHYNKNWESVCHRNCQCVYSQLSRCSYTPSTVIDGHRATRLNSVVTHCNSHDGMVIAALQQVAEWTTCLEDTIPDVIRILTHLQHKMQKTTRRVWPHVLQIVTDCRDAMDIRQQLEDASSASECSFTCPHDAYLAET